MFGVSGMLLNGDAAGGGDGSASAQSILPLYSHSLIADTNMKLVLIPRQALHEACVRDRSLLKRALAIERAYLSDDAELTQQAAREAEWAVYKRKVAVGAACGHPSLSTVMQSFTQDEDAAVDSQLAGTIELSSARTVTVEELFGLPQPRDSKIHNKRQVVDDDVFGVLPAAVPAYHHLVTQKPMPPVQPQLPAIVSPVQYRKTRPAVRVPGNVRAVRQPHKQLVDAEAPVPRPPADSKPSQRRLFPQYAHQSYEDSHKRFQQLRYAEWLPITPKQ